MDELTQKHGFVLLLCLFQQGLHNHYRIGAVLPEAAMTILVGMVAGCIIQVLVPSAMENPDEEYLTGDVVDSLLSFSPTAFFVVLLPPIIFNSGYHIRPNLFFRYITPICLYACLGTAICTGVIAGFLYLVKELFSFQVTLLELLAFGALISATDPVSTLAVFSSKKVDPHLFCLVFGESMINDAVGLVLFESLAHLVEFNLDGGNVAIGQEVIQFLFDFAMGFLGSLCLGTIFALAFAYFLKQVDLRSTPLLELCLYVTIMYFPFVVAEILRLSGIVTVLFTGIAARRYADPNLSSITRDNAGTVFRMTAHLTETIIFLELGLSAFALRGEGAFHLGFIGWSLLACLIGRAVNIYPITFFFNLYAGRGNSKEQLETETATASLEGNEKGLAAANKTTVIDDSEVPWAMAHMLWFSGLRGAVSYALVRTFPQTGNEHVFIVTTIVIVLLTTFVFGGSTEWALEMLKIPMNVDEAKYLRSLRKKKLLVGPVRRFEKTIRSWVIRDFGAGDKRVRSNKDVNNSNTVIGAVESLEDEEDNLEYCYQSQVELTTEQDFRRNKSSVYDFGQFSPQFIMSGATSKEAEEGGFTRMSE